MQRRLKGADPPTQPIAERRQRNSWWQLSVFTPWDLWILLRLVTGVVVWKYWSTDFGGLESLVGAAPVVTLEPDFLESMVSSFHGSQLNGLISIRAYQVAGGLLLLVGAFWRHRWVFAAGVALVASVTATAFRFSSTFYEYDFAIPIFTLFLVWFDWSAPNGRAHGWSPVAWSNLLGRSLGIYIGLAYFLAGWSKVVFDFRWPLRVHLENLSEAMTTWHAAPPSGALSYSSSALEALLALPAISAIAATTVLIAELCWIGCLASPHMRRVLHPLLAVSHVVIFLGSGILFKAWPLAAAALLTPWSRLFAVARAEPSVSPAELDPIDGTARASSTRRLAPFALAILAIGAPMVVGRTTFPLARYGSFGWTYAEAAEPRSFFSFAAMGADGELVVLDLNYFGFLDFVGPGRASTLISLSTDRPLSKSPFRAGICDIARAVRQHRSNEWLLGPFALPAHVMYSSTNPQTIFGPLVIVEQHWEDPLEDKTPKITVMQDVDFCRF